MSNVHVAAATATNGITAIHMTVAMVVAVAATASIIIVILADFVDRTTKNNNRKSN